MCNNQFNLGETRLPLKDIARELGTSERTLKEFLAIDRKLIPEIRELFDFLRAYYGIQHGGDRKSDSKKSKPNNSELISNEDLANTYNISSDTMVKI